MGEESQRSELAELAADLNQVVADQGVLALMEPASRSRHGQLIVDIDALERRAREYLGEARGVLGRIVELIGDPDPLLEVPAPPPLPPPRSPEPGENPEDRERRLRLLDREMRRRRGKRPVEGPAAAQPLVSSPQEDSGDVTQALDEEHMPVVIAFAEFEPPDTNETQMLTLHVGDEITALGQDEQGWWYGRKADGAEGWFPPSYVQLKD